MAEWDIVTHPAHAPEHCAVFPQILQGDKFIDTKVELPYHDNARIYVSFTAARKLGAFVGMLSPAELNEKLATVDAKVEAAEARASEAEADLLIAEMRIQFLEAHKASVEMILHDPDEHYKPPNGRKTYGR